jgi:thiol:disulfide interchange protein DsbD
VAGVVLALAWLIRADAGPAIHWIPFSEDALAQATADRRPVLIDFGADWCLPCREMERTTFRDPNVVRTATHFMTLKVDATAADGQVQAILDRFKVPGVPTYLLLGPDGRELTRFIGFVAADEFLRALTPLATGRG